MQGDCEKIDVNGEDVVKKFKYKLSLYWNFRYHHAVDDHNNLRN